MAAPPERVWQLLSDVTNVGRFSPETFEAEWLDGATAPAVGVQFRGHVRRNGRGPVYWTKCRIVACEPDREFGFTVDLRGKPVNTWRYQLQPNGDGTDVTESFELANTAMNRVYWKLAGRGSRPHEPQRHAHNARARASRGRSRGRNRSGLNRTRCVGRPGYPRAMQSLPEAEA